MAPLPRSRFERLLRGLSSAEHEQFVADLLAARGWRVERRGATIVACPPGAPDETRALHVVPDLRSAVSYLLESPDPSIDAVVVRGSVAARLVGTLGRGRLPGRRDGVDIVTVDDLYELFRYAIGDDDRSRLVGDVADRGSVEAGASGRPGLRSLVPRGTPSTAVVWVALLIVLVVVTVVASVLAPGSAVDIRGSPVTPTLETTPAPVPDTPVRSSQLHYPFVDPFGYDRITGNDSPVETAPSQGRPAIDLPSGCPSPTAADGTEPAIPLADLATELQRPNWTTQYTSTIRSDRGEYNPNDLHRMNWIPEARFRAAFVTPGRDGLVVRIVRWRSTAVAAARLDDLETEWQAVMVWGRYSFAANGYHANGTPLGGNTTIRLARMAFADVSLADGTTLGAACIDGLLQTRPESRGLAGDR